MAGRSKKAWDY